MKKLIRLFQSLILIGVVVTTFMEAIWHVTVPIGFSSIIGFELLNRIYIK